MFLKILGENISLDARTLFHCYSWSFSRECEEYSPPHGLEPFLL